MTKTLLILTNSIASASLALKRQGVSPDANGIKFVTSDDGVQAYDKKNTKGVHLYFTGSCLTGPSDDTIAGIEKIGIVGFKEGLAWLG